MAVRQTVWSVDVGKSSLKAIKMHRERNSLEILAVDKVNYPAESEGFDALHESKEAIRTFGARNEINCPVIIAHPGHSAFARFIQLPPVDAKKLEEMVGYEAQQQIPFPIDEVIWDYHICQDETSGAEKEVGIFAVRKEVISDFILDYENAGVTPDMISIGYLGLLNLVLYDLRPQSPSVVLDIGSDHTDLLIVDGRRFWIRNLPIAGNDFTQALQEKFKLSFAEADKLKQSAAKSDQAPKIFAVLQPVLKELLNEIHRSVGFYKSQAGDVKFDQIFLFGNGAKLLGMQKFLQEHLRFKVHVEKGFHRIRVNREANVALLQQDFPAFSAAVGTAIQALGEGEADVNLLPQEQQAALEFKQKQKIVLAAAASLYLLVAFLFFNYDSKVKSAQAAKDSTVIVQDLDQHKKEVAGLESDNEETLRAEEDLLIAYSADRRSPLGALEATRTVFAAFQNDESVSEKVEDSPEKVSALGELETAMEQLNEKKIWLNGVKVQRVLLDAQGNEVERRRRRRDRDREGASAIMAYRCEIYGLTYMGDNAQTTTELVNEKVKKPLEAELQRMGVGAGKEGPVTELKTSTEINKNFVEIEGFKERRVREQGEGSKIQGTFFPFVITWYQHAEPLPAAEKADE